jgi:hypothetical protein
MTIIEPERAYGKVSDKAIEEILGDHTTVPEAAGFAVVINSVDVREKQFPVSGFLGSPLEQLLCEMNLLLQEAATGSSTFEPARASVVWKGQSMEWIVLSHAENASDIRPISFGLRMDRVGEEMDLALYVLFRYRSPLNSDARSELADLLRKSTADLVGYNALEGLVREFVKRAAKRVAEKAGRPDSDGKSQGPIRL